MRMSVWKFENELSNSATPGTTKRFAAIFAGIGGEDQQRIGGGVVEDRCVCADVAGVAGHAHFDAADR